MTNRNTILNELTELSPELAGKDPHNNPYEVPVGYFNNLPEHMLALVNEPANIAASTQPYEVPQGYFEGLADAVLNRVKAIEANDPKEELKQAAPFLSSLKKENPYTLPEGYFEDLAGNATEGAKAIDLVNEELENLSPMMNALRSLNPYHVPTAYFETLPSKMLGKVSDTEKVPVITMRFTRRVLRMAVAASVAGLILFAGIRYLNTPFASSETSYAAGTVKDSTTILTNLSDEELEGYLDGNAHNTDATALNVTQEKVELNPENMKDLLAEVSDEELQKFLEETGTQTESMTN